MSVSLSAGLPLCFPIKSICLSFQWSDWLPITQATGSLSLQPSVSLSVCPVIAQAGRLFSVCPGVFLSQSCLPVCLPVHPPCHSPPPPFLSTTTSWAHSSPKTASPAATKPVP